MGPGLLLIGTDATQAEATTTDYDDEFGGGSDKFVGYSVTAYDCAGNTTTKSITMVPHVIQEDGSSFNGRGVAFTYEGNWETSTYSGFSGGHTRKTSAEGASVTIDVNPICNEGQHVALVMEKAPNRGEAEIYVDGVYETTINTYSTTTEHRVIVFDVGLSAGPHTITVVNKATPGHPRIDLDAVLTNGLFS